MKNAIKAMLVATLMGSATLFSPASAIEARIEVGILSCEVEAGSGFVLGSKKDMRCTFNGIDDFSETYTGTVRKFGLDIGQTDRTIITWAVFAPTTEMEARALEGNYAGISAEATLGVGIGANAMLGGFDRSIALQPLSGQYQEGANIAAGIGTMTLRAN